jgi:membrane associated rhomboid family serine protease
MFPVSDYTRIHGRPYVNWTLIAINVAVLIYMLTLGSDLNQVVGDFVVSAQEKFLFDFGFVAACLGGELGFDVNATPSDLTVCPAGQREFGQVFTSMFVHAGLLHLAGNMLFLWIFGDNVEDRMGHIRYLIFYLLCGIAAALVQTFIALDTVIPSVGASGAIAGIMGAYLILHPFGKVRVIIIPLIFWPFVVPAIVLIGIWFLMQLVSGIGELGQATAGSGVAWWAHVGGFIAGVVLIWFFRRPERRRWLGREATG